MVIFHSYVSLPEGTLVFNPQAVPPSSNVPSVSSFTAFSCCGAASSSPKARNHSAEVRWFSSAASRRVLVANMASAPTPARPWVWRGPKGSQGDGWICWETFMAWWGGDSWDSTSWCSWFLNGLNGFYGIVRGHIDNHLGVVHHFGLGHFGDGWWENRFCSKIGYTMVYPKFMQHCRD